MKVKCSADAEERGRIEAVDVRSHPSFLLRGGKTDPDEIGTAVVNAGNHPVIFC